MTEEQYKILSKYERQFMSAKQKRSVDLYPYQVKEINPISKQLIGLEFPTCSCSAQGKISFLAKLADLYYKYASG